MEQSAKKEVYVLIYDAQEADLRGDTTVAYERYLRGISVLSCLLIGRGAPTKQSEFDSELKLAVKTLKTCTERLEELVTLAESPKGSNSKLIAKSTSVVEPVANLSQQLQLSPPVVSPILQKANRDNELLKRIYEGRISRCTNSRTKATLQLELQRRMSENLSLARKKEAEETLAKERKEREALAKAARKLLEASNNGKIDVLKELDTNESQFNPQILYAKVLQYDEQNQTKVVTAASHIPSFVESVFRNASHPINKWLMKFQRGLVDKIDPLLSKYLTKMSERESTNLIYDFTESTEEELKELCENRLINQLETEALERHCEIIANDLKLAFELLNQMFAMQISVQLSDSNHELLTLQLSDHIYTPIWNRIIALFSIVYCNAENAFRSGAQSMLMNKSSEELHDELSAGFSGDSVLKQFNPKECAEQIKSVAILVNPFRKLKLLTKFVRELCERVNCSEQIGADHLVPMLVLVLLNCNVTKIVVDCEAIEQLASSKALLGQDGYCLSSFQTALKYIEMHGKN